MKMNIPIDPIEGETDADRPVARVRESGDSPNAPIAAISRRRSFPLRTLMVCFTAWLIATEVLIFDEVKFNAKAELLEQAARALRSPQIIVPSERAPSFPSDAKMHKL
jgi:hypothetical protein